MGAVSSQMERHRRPTGDRQRTGLHSLTPSDRSQRVVENHQLLAKEI